MTIRYIKFKFLILLFLIPLVNVAQNSLEQRKKEFYSIIETLRLKPEESFFKIRSGNYNNDSVQDYYDFLLSGYNDMKEVVSEEQTVFWLYEIGIIENSLGYTDLASKSFENAIEHTDKSMYSEVYVQLNIKLGDAYRHIGMKKKSNEILLDIIDSPILQADSALQISCLGLVAENYENLGDYQLAAEISMLLYDYYLKRNDLANASYRLIQLGRLGSFLEVDTSYFEYFHLANKMALTSGDKGRIENNLVNTGNAYRKAGYPAIALKYLKKAKEYSEFNSSYGSVYTILGLCSAYLMLDSIPQAYVYAKMAMKSAQKINAYNWIYHSKTKLARCYIEMQHFDSARLCLTEALKLSRVLNNKTYPAELFKQLSEVSIKLEDYPTAILYLDSSYTEYAKFVTEKNDDKLAQLRVESDYYIHRNRITELVSNNKIEKEKSRKLIAITLGVITILILTFYFTMIIRKRLKLLRESYVNLVKKNIELDDVNSKLRICEITPKKKVKLENIKHEDLIIKKLSELFRDEEVFTNPDLSLKSLADDIDTNTSYLSAAVNSHYNCNLPSLINQHRIDKARKMLVASEFKHYSMEGIASEVGFKTRSVFYQSFKTITGLSPSLYIENYKLIVSE